VHPGTLPTLASLIGPLTLAPRLGSPPRASTVAARAPYVAVQPEPGEQRAPDGRIRRHRHRLDHVLGPPQPPVRSVGIHEEALVLDPRSVQDEIVGEGKKEGMVESR